MARLGRHLANELARLLTLSLDGGGGDGEAPLAPIKYVNNLSVANFYTTANPGGEPGADTGWWSAALIAAESPSLPAGFRTYKSRTTGTAGFTKFFDSTGQTMRATVYNGVGGVVQLLPGFPIQGGFVNKWILDFIVHTGPGNQVLRYINGVRWGVPLTCVGYSPGSSATNIGRRSVGDLGGGGLRYAGDAGGLGVPSDEDVYNYYLACVEAGGIVTTMPGATLTHSASVARDAVASAPATLTDSPGSDNLTRNGSPGFGQDLDPEWVRYCRSPLVYLGVGDSEMQGQVSHTLLPPTGVTGYPSNPMREYMVRLTTSVVEPLSEPCGRTGGVGPAGFFAWLRRQATGRDVIIVNSGWSAIRSDQQLPGSSAYSESVVKLAEALSIPGAEFAGTIHYDGYNDMFSAPPVGDWITNWTAIRNQYCEDFPVMAGKPWVYVVLKAGFGGVDPVPVRTMQAAWAGSDTNGTKYPVAMPEDLELIDNVHASINGNYRMAQLLSAAWPAG